MDTVCNCQAGNHLPGKSNAVSDPLKRQNPTQIHFGESLLGEYARRLADSRNSR